MIRPSINAVAETYDLAVREEALASAQFINYWITSKPILTYRRKCRRFSFTK